MKFIFRYLPPGDFQGLIYYLNQINFYSFKFYLDVHYCNIKYKYFFLETTNSLLYKNIKVILKKVKFIIVISVMVIWEYNLNHKMSS